MRIRGVQEFAYMEGEPWKKEDRSKHNRKVAEVQEVKHTDEIQLCINKNQRGSIQNCN